MKELLFLLSILFTLGVNAQTYLISFAGSGASGTVNSVRVENLTKGAILTLNGNDILRLTGTTGVISGENKPRVELNIYPNPMIDFTVLKIHPPATGSASLAIYDMSGKVVIQIQRYLEKIPYEFRISGLKSGFYLVSIVGNSFQFTGKLLCNGNVEGKVAIEMISSNQTSVIETKKNEAKGSQTTFDMAYSSGDKLKFKGTSGNYSTIIIDSPASDKTITFNFIACTDADNNNYPVVKINNQIWMAENLKSQKYGNGNLIGTTTPATLDLSGENTPKYQWAYDGNEGNVATYGRLYTWYAITDSRNVCPVGWHVPTDDDLMVLTEYLENSGFGYQGNGNDIGKAMASVSGWNIDPTAGNVGNDQGSNNSSGFEVFPAGYRSFTGTFISKESGGFWWSNTEASEINAFARALRSYSEVVYNYYNTKKNGYSVRCLKN